MDGKYTVLCKYTNESTTYHVGVYNDPAEAIKKQADIYKLADIEKVWITWRETNEKIL